MRIVFSVVMVLFFWSCNETSKSFDEEKATEIESSQDIDKPETEPDLSSLKGIKKAYQNIYDKVNSKEIDSTFFNYKCYEKTGKVTYFSEKNELLLIKHTYQEASHFSATEYFYVNENSPFFVFYDELAWSFDTDAENPRETRDKISEKRFYIIENEIVKCLEKDFVIRSSLTDNPKSEEVSNKEVDCPSSEVILQKFKIFNKYKGQKQQIDCLTEKIK